MYFDTCVNFPLTENISWSEEHTDAFLNYEQT